MLVASTGFAPGSGARLDLDAVEASVLGTGDKAAIIGGNGAVLEKCLRILSLWFETMRKAAFNSLISSLPFRKILLTALTSPAAGKGALCDMIGSMKDTATFFNEGFKLVKADFGRSAAILGLTLTLLSTTGCLCASGKIFFFRTFEVGCRTSNKSSMKVLKASFLMRSPTESQPLRKSKLLPISCAVLSSWTVTGPIACDIRLFVTILSMAGNFDCGIWERICSWTEERPFFAR